MKQNSFIHICKLLSFPTAVFLIGCAVGSFHFASLRTNRSAVLNVDMLYGNAVMVAYGHGSIAPSMPAYPELREFLFAERQSLSPEMFPEPIITTSNSVAEYHRYLIYTVGMVWRVLGVSWASLEPLLVLMLAWTALVLYGLMRLGMNRVLSLACTVLIILSPAMLSIVIDLRDFSKAPFLLTLLLGLGWLTKHRFPLRRICITALLLGILTGIAMGFRQDALIFSLFSFTALLTIGYRTSGRKISAAALPAALYLLCFLVTAWPMLLRMEAAAAPDHHIIQGFSEKHHASLGVYSTTYKPLLAGSDEYAFAAYADYAQRVATPKPKRIWFDGPGAERSARTWLMDMAKTFPADLLLRGYASAMRTFRYADAFPPRSPEPTRLHATSFSIHRALAEHLHRFGIVYAIVTLACIATYDFALSMGLFIFSLYLFGYVSLQCETRHAFHLIFAPFWVMGFLIQRALCSAYFFKRHGLPDRHIAKQALIRATTFVICCAILAVTPLLLLRTYQNYSAQAVISPILAADRNPCPVMQSTTYGWTAFTLNKTADHEHHSDLYSLCKSIALMASPDLRLYHVRSRYFAAEFEGDADLSWIILDYESSLPNNDFSQLVNFPAKSFINGRTVFYFPAYEILYLFARHEITVNRNRFTGIAVPEEHAHAFKGLYEIKNLSDLNLLVSIIAPENKLSGQLYLKALWKPDLLSYYQYETLTEYAGLAEAAERQGRIEEAVFFYRALMYLGREPQSVLTGAGKLVALGQMEAALEGLHEIAGNPKVSQETIFGLLYKICDTGITKNDLALTWDALLLLEDSSGKRKPDMRFQIARACFDTGMKEQALAAFGEIVAESPIQEAYITKADEFIRGRFSPEEQAAFWQRAIDSGCLSHLPWLYLGRALEADGQAAAEAYKNAYAANKNDGETILCYATTNMDTVGVSEVIALIKKAIDSQPDLMPMAAARLLPAIVMLQQSGEHEDALLLTTFAETITQEKEPLHLQQAEALIALGRYEEAETLLNPLLDTPFSDRATALLDQVFKLNNSVEERAALWTTLAETYPANEAVTLQHRIAMGDLGMSLLASSDYAAALAAFETACVPACQQPLFNVGLHIAEIALHPEEKHTQAIAALIREQPGLAPLAVSHLLRAAETQQHDGRQNEARILAEAAATLDPGSGSGLFQLGITEEAAGNPAGAKAHYRQAIEQSSDKVKMAEMVNEHLRTLCGTGERREFWGELVNASPDMPAARLYLACALEEEGRYPDALPHFKTLVDIFSGQADFQAHYGGVLAATGGLDEGMERMSNALLLDAQWAPLVADIAVRAGDACVAKDEIVSALRLYRFALDSHPHHVLGGLKLGKALTAAGNIKDAGDTYREVIRRAPDTPAAREAAREWDDALKAQGNVEARVSAWRETTEMFPDVSFLLEYYLPALAASGAVKEAIAVCESASAHHGDADDLRFTYAALLYLSGRFEEGKQLLVPEYASASPGVLDLATEAARAAITQQEGTAAEQMLHCLTTASPENLLYKMLLGESLALQDRHDEALSWYMQVLAVSPESPRTAALLDVSCNKSGDPDACARIWKELSEKHPDSQVLQQYLMKSTPRDNLSDSGKNDG